MKRIFLFITMFSFLTHTTSAQAEDSTIYPLKKGESSPFEGLLLTPSAVASIIADRRASEQSQKILVQKCEEKSQLDLSRCEGEAKLASEKKSAIFEKEKSDLLSNVDALRADIKKKDILLSKPDNTNYYFLGGIALGVSATLLTTYVISSTSH
jgi:hypothetical protein